MSEKESAWSVVSATNVKKSPAPTSSLMVAAAAAAASSTKNGGGRVGGSGRDDNSSSGGSGRAAGGLPTRHASFKNGSNNNKSVARTNSLAPPFPSPPRKSIPQRSYSETSKKHVSPQRSQSKKLNSASNHRSSSVGSNNSAAKGGGSNNHKQPPARSNSSRPTTTTTRLEDVTLLTTGDTATDTVRRYAAERFFACRMQYVSAPPHNNKTSNGCWSPHPECSWSDDATRLQHISDEMGRLWNYKPLEVNEATRFKARIMQVDDAKITSSSSAAEQLRAATGILNKLSWTTLDRLAAQFIQALADSGGGQDDDGGQVSPATVQASMQLVVDKAMQEPHFAELYAHLLHKLAVSHKVFRKTALSICQAQFEAVQNQQQPALPADLDPAEREFALNKIRKQRIGLMSFIGELYKLGLIKARVMSGCVQNLLIPDDEEALEYFAKLMTTAGKSLEEHEKEDGVKEVVQEIWCDVESLAGRRKRDDNGDGGPTAPSTRIKFLMQDLLELRSNDWVLRREGDKAKTIQEIHQQVLAEEQAKLAPPPPAAPPLRSNRMTRTQSGGSNLLRGPSAVPASVAAKETAPATDDDGFTQIPSKSKRNSSMRRSRSDAAPGLSSLQRAMQSQQPLRKTNNNSGKPNGKSSPGIPPDTGTAPKQPQRSRSPSPPATRSESVQSLTIPELLDPKECGEKTKNVLKEYFVGGDTADAIQSLDELVGSDQEGHVQRGAAVLEAAILLVMEMKEGEARKALAVLTPCLQSGKISPACLRQGGLNDALEFLRDIEIDAPMAGKLLAMLLAEWINANVLQLDVLLDAPEYFKTDGRPADFAVQLLARCSLDRAGGGLSNADVSIVTQLMSEAERAQHASVREWVENELERAKR